MATFTDLPFSFRYGDRDSRHILAEWPSSEAIVDADQELTTTTSWADPVGGLIVRWIVTEYVGLPNCRWRVEFAQTGDERSAVLEDVLALDLSVPTPGDCVLRTNLGSNISVRDFQPLAVPLTGSQHRLFTSHQGRPCSFDQVPDADASFVKNGWPYFNVDFGTSGLIVAIGWAGQWGLEASRTDSAVHLRGGMVQRDEPSGGDRIGHLELMRTWLEPGEVIRTPDVVIQPWDDPSGWGAAQNGWRRWMLERHLPRGAVELKRPVLSGTHYDLYATADEQVDWIERYRASGATASSGGGYTSWWVDAGWNEGVGEESERAWARVGTWRPDRRRYPDGLTPVVDAARDAGLSFILWFEPERVRLGSELADEHPEWLLAPPEGYQSYLRAKAPVLQQEPDDRMLDFGDDEAREWITQRVNGILHEAGIDRPPDGVPGFYREDFNCNPLVYWAHSDPPGRRGITQAKHIAGHRRFWEDVLAANPRLLIDTCASGGRRLDVDTLSLSVPLLRSDHVREPHAQQGHTYGLSQWLPLQGTQVSAYLSPEDRYLLRSSFTGLLMIPVDPSDPAVEWPELALAIEEWDSVRHVYAGDYFPLTEYDPSDAGWLAWQFAERDGSRSVVQVFLREDPEISETSEFRLHGLDADALYTVREHSESWTPTARVETCGADLMADGLTVTAAGGSAFTFVVERVDG